MTGPRYRFHGDPPCTRCVDEQRRPVQRATHHSMCARHWLGATEAQRRSALFDEAADERLLDADDALRAWSEAA